MSLRLGALHDALLDPGNADLARKAAEEVANYENRLARVAADLLVIKWMIGTHMALTLIGLGLLFRLAGHV